MTTMRPTHPRHTDKNGRIWVTRSIVGCRKIPGFGSVDPLTLPLLARPSAARNLRARLEVAERRWRETTWGTWTGTDSEEDARVAAMRACRALSDRLGGG